MKKVLALMLLIAAAPLAPAWSAEEELNVVPAPAAATDKKDIVTTAVEAGSFGTLATALDAADLIETLKGEGPFTVFAPNDEAFAKQPAGAVEQWLAPENKDKLTKVLTYHVVPGKIMAADVITMKAATVNGQDLDVVKSETGVTVNGANVIQTDIECSNGVIHVIDQVLMPQES